MDNNRYEIGYKNPPKSTRYKKGQSGNPNGRPRSRHQEAPYEAVLGQELTVVINGRKRTVTASEALLLKLSKDGVSGNAAAARLLEGVLALEKQESDEDALQEIPDMNIRVIKLGTLGPVMRPLRIAKKKKRFSSKAEYLLEPWIVQKAIDRLPGQLSIEEQRMVTLATRCPNKVKWPDWWEAELSGFETRCHKPKKTATATSLLPMASKCKSEHLAKVEVVNQILR